VDVSQTIPNYCGIFERMRQSMMRLSRRALNLMEDIVSTYY
jgi:hypothetical protein